MNLLAQNPWWLAPFVLLMLLMLHAMMEFTVSLLVRRPPVKRKPITSAELRRRLLAVTHPDPSYQLAAGQDCDLEFRWQQEAAAPSRRFAITRTASGGRIRLLLDERRHEVRLNQVSHSYYVFFGFVGWVPHLRGSAGFQSGPADRALTDELSLVANRGGWSVRPVLWWFQATYQGYRRLRSLTPAPFRRWPARRFWGVLYPLSYGLGMAYLVIIAGPLNQRGWLILLGVSAGWWGIWGLLSWILVGLPAFWRRPRR